MNRDANTPGFVQIGRIIRSQGMNGELRVSLEADYNKAVENLQLVYLRNDRGDFYPARISNIRAEGKGNSISFFVQFEHIADRSSAEKLKDHGIFLETKNATDFIQKEPEKSSYIDHEVFDDQNNAVGLVVDVMENPAHPILVVATTSGTRLIPFVEHYVTKVSDQNIYCQNLEQLEGI
ncbi:MAG: ribosome maturation factor RimM [Balneolaceae bacterium]